MFDGEMVDYDVISPNDVGSSAKSFGHCLHLSQCLGAPIVSVCLFYRLCRQQATSGAWLYRRGEVLPAEIILRYIPECDRSRALGHPRSGPIRFREEEGGQAHAQTSLFSLNHQGWGRATSCFHHPTCPAEMGAAPRGQAIIITPWSSFPFDLSYFLSKDFGSVPSTHTSHPPFVLPVNGFAVPTTNAVSLPFFFTGIISLIP